MSNININSFLARFKKYNKTTKEKEELSDHSVTNEVEFKAQSTGTQIIRDDGIAFEKNAKGAWQKVENPVNLTAETVNFVTDDATPKVTFSQTEPASIDSIGEVWYDTDNGNWYISVDSGIVSPVGPSSIDTANTTSWVGFNNNNDGNITFPYNASGNLTITFNTPLWLSYFKGEAGGNHHGIITKLYYEDGTTADGPPAPQYAGGHTITSTNPLFTYGRVTKLDLFTYSGQGWNGKSTLRAASAPVWQEVSAGIDLSSIAQDIIPTTDNVYSLGSATKMWKDVFIGPGSLYVNGKKVLEEASDAIVVSADINQNLTIQTSGSGDIELDPTGTGIVQIKGTLQIENGTNITNSAGANITFANGIETNSITSFTDGSDLTLGGKGSGSVNFNDGFKIASVAVTSSAAELNILDGVTATAAELNKLSGVSSNIQTQLDAKASSASLATVATSGSYADLTNKPTIPSITGLATETYVDTAVSNVVNSAPATLDTLNELAAALGDDPNFATTVSTNIGTKWTQDNTKISNWDTAYSWGNHASAGYITSLSGYATTSYVDTAVANSTSGVQYSAQSAAPSSPSEGDEWYDSDDGSFYKYLHDGTTGQWVEWGPNNSLNGSEDIVASIVPNTTNTHNLGASALRLATVYATTFNGTATQAQYADLAEKYTADATYEPGTVLMLGGTAEVTASNTYATRKIAGIVSTNPAHLMNNDLTSEHVAEVALLGRVPCFVVGTCEKGDLLVASNTTGCAIAWTNTLQDPPTGSVIGKALENKTTEEQNIIEVMVGRV